MSNVDENFGYLVIDFDDESFNKKIEALLFVGIPKKNIIVDYEKGKGRKERQAFGRLLKLIEEKKVKKVVVFKLKELDSTYGESINAIAEIEQKGNGARILTLDCMEDGYNSASSYMDRYLMSIIFCFEYIEKSNEEMINIVKTKLQK